VISLFKNKSILTVVLLILLGFGLHTHLFVHQTVQKLAQDSGILSFVFNDFVLDKLYISISPYLFVVIILSQSILLNEVLDDLKMYTKNGFTTALSYIILSAIIPQWSFISPALLANFFIIWIFVLLSKLYNIQNPKATLFNIGLVAGGAFLCYYPTVILTIVAFFALAVVRPFRLAEWFVLLFGILMPIYLFMSILFLTDNMQVIYSTVPKFKLSVPLSHHDIWLYIKIMAIILMLLIGLQYWSTQNNRMIIQIRKYWGIMIVVLILMLPIPFVVKSGGFSSAILCIVPLSAFIGNAYLYPKKAFLPNLLLLISLVLIIHTNWFLIKG